MANWNPTDICCAGSVSCLIMIVYPRIPRGQDALHQAALLQQLGGSSEGPAWGGTTAGPCYPSPLPSPWSAYKERAASVHTHAPPLLTQTRPLPV